MKESKNRTAIIFAGKKFSFWNFLRVIVKFTTLNLCDFAARFITKSRTFRIASKQTSNLKDPKMGEAI